MSIAVPLLFTMHPRIVHVSLSPLLGTPSPSLSESSSLQVKSLSQSPFSPVPESSQATGQVQSGLQLSGHASSSDPSHSSSPSLTSFGQSDVSGGSVEQVQSSLQFPGHATASVLSHSSAPSLIPF